LTQEDPELLKQALRVGLTGRQPIGYLELGAKLQKEFGNGHEAGGQIPRSSSSSAARAGSIWRSPGRPR